MAACRPASGGKRVEEMNRVGILIDLSHCGERTTLDTIEGIPPSPSRSPTRIRGTTS